jgi:hypothetical protein
MKLATIWNGARLDLITKVVNVTSIMFPLEAALPANGQLVSKEKNDKATGCPSPDGAKNAAQHTEYNFLNHVLSGVAGGITVWLGMRRRHW